MFAFTKHTTYKAYSALKMCLIPSLFLLFLFICQTEKFQVSKQILIVNRDNASKHKMQFLNNDFIS